MQINLLEETDILVENSENLYWYMSNGYALPVRADGIKELGHRLLDASFREKVSDSIRVGVHWSTQVLLRDEQRVTQVFTSALPISYTQTKSRDWELFARTVLYSAFYSTLAVGAILSRRRQSRVTVYLTCIGGGVFGNDHRWIADAISKAVGDHIFEALDVKLVHYYSMPGNFYTKVNEVVTKLHLDQNIVITAPSVRKLKRSSSVDTEAMATAETNPRKMSKVQSLF